MRIDVDVSQHQLTWEEIRARVKFAEDAGFDGAWIFDHFKPLYGDPAGPCLEAWTLLGGLAASTSRIRLGTLVTGVTYRHPAVLAAQAVTVDHITGGRLDFGIGAAWFEREHNELGIAFPPARERAERLDEALAVFKAIMTDEGATFEGRHYRLRNAGYHPKPVQRPHPPIWVGAGGERLTLAIAARHADVWHWFGPVESLVRKSAILDQHAARAGRDPASIARSTMLSISEDWDEVRTSVSTLRSAGFTRLVVSWPSEGWPRLREFAEKMLPELSPP